MYAYVNLLRYTTLHLTVIMLMLLDTCNIKKEKSFLPYSTRAIQHPDRAQQTIVYRGYTLCALPASYAGDLRAA